MFKMYAIGHVKQPLREECDVMRKARFDHLPKHTAIPSSSHLIARHSPRAIDVA